MTLAFWRRFLPARRQREPEAREHDHDVDVRLRHALLRASRASRLTADLRAQWPEDNALERVYLRRRLCETEGGEA